MPTMHPPGARMLDEIHQQAHLAQSWADAGGYQVGAIADAVAAYAPTSVTLIARGTSDNAAGYAKYLFEIMGGYVVSSASPSTMTLYGARPRASRSACIAVSQSSNGGGRPEHSVRRGRSIHHCWLPKTGQIVCHGQSLNFPGIGGEDWLTVAPR